MKRVARVRPNLALAIPSLLAAFLTSGLTNQALGQRVQPMLFDLAPTGQAAEETLIVENTTDGTLTVEVVATAMELAENGEETRSPADNAFLIFPPTAVIRPGDSQAVRVRYVGEPEIDASRSYWVSVKQVPVVLGEGATGISLVVHFDTLANVVPPGATPDPIVQSIEADSNNGVWTLTIRNAGNRYVRLSTTEWTFRGTDGRTTTLSGPEIAMLIDGNLILPHSVRAIRMPAVDGFSPSDTDIRIKAPN